MKILIVDDSDTSRLLLQSILQGAGYDDLLQVGNAEEAIDLLLRHARREKALDLVLMDIAMPGMNGIEATRKIKSNAELFDTPVVIVTADGEEESLLQAFEAGATDYITKPVRKIELQARVRAALRLKMEMDKRKAREKELEAMTNQLMALSNQDGLTGLANRRCFDDMLTKEFLRARREGRSLCLLMFDIDHFKAYNDFYGHVMGDQCLRQVAKAALKAARRPGDFVARYGGEEFVLLLPNTEIEGAMVVGQDLQAAIKEEGLEHKASDVSSLVTVSIGVACNSIAAPPSPEDLVDLADKALYEAKRRGRNAICQSLADDSFCDVGGA